MKTIDLYLFGYKTQSYGINLMILILRRIVRTMLPLHGDLFENAKN